MVLQLGFCLYFCQSQRSKVAVFVCVNWLWRSVWLVWNMKVLTSGLKGASINPASSIRKLISWKNGWALTSLPPEPEQPSLSLGFFFNSYSRHNSISDTWSTPSCVFKMWFSWTHRSADVLHLVAEPLIVRLLFFRDPHLQLLPHHVLFSTFERRLCCSHLVNQAAEAPPVHAQTVFITADHLRSWKYS